MSVHFWELVWSPDTARYGMEVAFQDATRNYQRGQTKPVLPAVASPRSRFPEILENFQFRV
eukprot:1599699-Amphidinium_carterae.1